MDELKQRFEAVLHVLRPHFLKYWRQLVTVLIFVVILFLFSPPLNFPTGSIVVIEHGSSAPMVAKELYDAHVIAHPSFLQFILRVGGKSDSLQAGAYLFKEPQNLLSVAYRIATGSFGLPPFRIMFHEGMTVSEMATQVADDLPSVSANDFIRAGSSYEGYLFPDTYFFTPALNAEAMVNIMRENFDTKMKSISADITASGHSLSDIIIMASLIEKEARTTEDKQIVAGILWNRLKIGMPLQVDAAMETYKHKGLTPEPICNPGLDSILAVLHPTNTSYIYYLTGKDGLMHYATTFVGHQTNRAKYLN